MRHQPNCYYCTLGAAPSGSPRDIRVAYFAASRLAHPDRCPASKKRECTQLFQKVNEAYQCLSNPESRRNYEIRCGFSGIKGEQWDLEHERNKNAEQKAASAQREKQRKASDAAKNAAANENPKTRAEEIFDMLFGKLKNNEALPKKMEESRRREAEEIRRTEEKIRKEEQEAEEIRRTEEEIRKEEQEAEKLRRTEEERPKKEDSDSSSDESEDENADSSPDESEDENADSSSDESEDENADSSSDESEDENADSSSDESEDENSDKDKAARKAQRKRIKKEWMKAEAEWERQIEDRKREERRREERRREKREEEEREEERRREERKKEEREEERRREERKKEEREEKRRNRRQLEFEYPTPYFSSRGCPPSTSSGARWSREEEIFMKTQRTAGLSWYNVAVAVNDRFHTGRSVSACSSKWYACR